MGQATRTSTLLAVALSAVLALTNAASVASPKAVHAPQSVEQRQPPPFNTPPRPADFLHMRLDVTLTQADIEARTMRAVVTHRIRALPAAAADADAAPLRKLPLDAVGLEVEDVRLAEPGADAEAPGELWPATTFDRTEEQIIIDLEPPLEPGRERLVRIRYSAKRPRLGLHFVLPSDDQPDRPTTVYTQAEPLQGRYWLPCHDWPDTRWPSDTYLTVARPYTGVCIGVPVEAPVDVEGEGGEKLRRFHWRQETPVDPHMYGFAVGEFIALEDEWRGRPVLVYTPPRYADAARYSFARVPDMLEFYSERIGVECPFPRMAHVAVQNHFHGGMEHVGLDYVAPHLLTQSDRDGDVPADVSQFNYVAHMLAHQWFGGVVNYQRITEAWVNEGFATYLHTLWRGRAYSYDPPPGEAAGVGAATVRERQWSDRVSGDWVDDELWDIARGIARFDAPAAEPIVNHRITDPGMIYAFGGGRVYWKGAWVLHMLRRQLGDEAFWGGVRGFLTRHRGEGVTTADLRAALEQASGRDLAGFFGQWVYRGGTPRLGIDYAWKADEGVAQLTLEQMQGDGSDADAMRFPLTFYFGFGDGGESQTVDVTDATHVFEFAFEAPPDYVAVDPRGDLLKTVEIDLPNEMWIAQARHGPTALARSLAVDPLASVGDEQAVQTLGELLLDDGLFWGTRRRAAEALGRIGGEPVLALLLKAAGGERVHPRVLEAVADALARFGDSREAHAALLGMCDAGVHMRVRSSALAGLRRCHADESLMEATIRAARKAALPGGGAYVRRSAMRTLERLNDAAVVDALIAATQAASGDSVEMRAASIELLTKLADQHQARRSAVLTHLAALLGDADPRIRAAAVEGVGNLGDASLLPRVEPLTGDDQPRSVRRAARTAMRKLGAGAEDAGDGG